MLAPWLGKPLCNAICGMLCHFFKCGPGPQAAALAWERAGVQLGGLAGGDTGTCLQVEDLLLCLVARGGFSWVST